MNKEEIALIISMLSFGVAALALGWNIYRDVILKPRLQVTVKKSLIAREGRPNTTHLMISGVNFGPGAIRLNIIRFMHSFIFSKLLKKWRHGVLIHDYRNPLSGQLPTSLEIGEKIDLIFPWDEECLCSSKPTHIGLADSFGRTHWASKKEVKKVIKEWEADFEN
ncbi:hypothetical protein [Thiohalophilus sp.]|uniref:hypothetical protein n=1 Tax=Thiohalophilus sp. TaxID=3028392 RepID=UPI002ACE3D63|nr:hypothetical protein [Thiohalophilus sp.]MDZ7660927.1 hypothetical protein [Thiohalophilus sp.]